MSINFLVKEIIWMKSHLKIYDLQVVRMNNLRANSQLIVDSFYSVHRFDFALNIARLIF